MARGWCRDCWRLGVCRWGSLQLIWTLVEIPGVSGSWFSLLFREFLCSTLASLSKECQVHPSQRSQTSNNHPWRKWPGRSHHWTWVSRTRKKSVTDGHRSYFHDQVGNRSYHEMCLSEGDSQGSSTEFEQALQACSIPSQSHLSPRSHPDLCDLLSTSPG